MQVKLVIFPAENSLNVVIWGKWAKGSMRVRQFENRTEMIETFKTLGLVDESEGQTLESFAVCRLMPAFFGRNRGSRLSRTRLSNRVSSQGGLTPCRSAARALRNTPIRNTLPESISEFLPSVQTGVDTTFVQVRRLGA